jgi:transcriptional regulator with XRE-family HTH domain
MKKGSRRYENWSREGFAGWLQDRLLERSMTITDLGKAIGSPTTLVSRWMTGRQIPSVENLMMIARTMKIPYQEIYHAAGYDEDPLRPASTDPRLTSLHQRLDVLRMTHDRYLAINALLTSMEMMDAASERPRSDMPAVVRQEPARQTIEIGQSTPPSPETVEFRSANFPT